MLFVLLFNLFVKEVIKGKLKESIIVAIAGDPLDTDNDDDPIEELALFAF